jgi:hypothetical protein
MLVPPGTVQDAAPEVGHPYPLNPHVASRLLRGGRRKITASTTNPKAAPHLVIYVPDATAKRLDNDRRYL